MRASKTQIKLIGALIVVAGLIAHAAHGATIRTWDGGGTDNNWMTAGNWVGNIAPVAGDDLVFPANASVDATSLTSTNNFPASTAFRSIKFQSGSTNYVLNGNAILFTNAGVVAISGQSGGTNTVNLAMQLNADQVFEQTAAGGLVIKGAINLNGNNLTNNVSNSAGNIQIPGQISGSGEVVKSGSGTMVLNGSVANTYVGITRVNGGTLVLDDTGGAVVMVPGDLIISNATVRIDDVNGNEIADNSNVTIFSSDGSVRFDLNNHNETIGTLTMRSGELATGTGTLTCGDITGLGSGTFFAAKISGNLNLGGVVRTIDVQSGLTTPELEILAVISNGGIIKTGPGQLSLFGTNTYSGLTTVSNGNLRVHNPFGLGSTNIGTVIEGGNLYLDSAVVQGEPLTNNSASAQMVSSFACGWSGRIVLNQDLDISVYPNTGTNDLSGSISGSGAIRKVGDPANYSGTLIYSGSSANTYTNTTTVNVGTLLLRKSIGNASILGPLISGDGTNAAVVQNQTASQIGNVPITVKSNATFDLNGIGEIFGSLAGSGNVTLGGAGINFGGDNSSTVFSGVISETGAITKSGTGTMTLSGNNTFVGFTTVSGGTLLVNGSQPQSPVIVNGTGTLGGSGTVGNISGGANVAPGASPGILTCSNLTFTSGGDYFVELYGLSPGVGYDQLKVRGTNNLANAVLHITPNFPGLMPLGSQFVIITNDGVDSITGTFSGLPEGAAVSTNGYSFLISYAGGSGNDVVLTLTNQPTSFTNPPDLYFTNAAGGDFLLAYNWSPNFVPREPDNAHFTNATSPLVTWSAGRSNANAFFDAPSGIVTQAIGGFTWLLTNSYVVARESNTTARVVHTSGALRVTNSAGTAQLIIGQDGDGTFDLQGGTVIADQLVVTNASIGSPGSSIFNFNSGTLQTLNGATINDFTSDGFRIGTNSGQVAIWNITGGTSTLNVSNGVVLGSTLNSRGTVSITGASTLVTNTSVFAIGLSGASNSFNLSGGAQLISGNVFIGENYSASNNLVTLVGSNAQWTARSSPVSEFEIGTQSPGNQLLISQGASLRTTVAIVGTFTGSSNNLVLVTDPGSMLTNEDYLYIGNSGTANRLVVSNGGYVASFFAVIGSTAGPAGNSVLITDTNSVIYLANNGASHNGDALDIGTLSDNNSLVISNGGALLAADQVRIDNNSDVTITGPGSSMTNKLMLLGSAGPGNHVTVANGGRFQGAVSLSGAQNDRNLLLITGNGSMLDAATVNINGTGSWNMVGVTNGGSVVSSSATLGFSSSTSNNVAWVSGSGSSWSNQFTFTIGRAGAAHQLIITNGASVSDPFGIIGDQATANGNSVIVSDTGSIWNNRTNLIIGNNGSFNQLIVSNSGTVVAARLTIGTNSTSTNNVCLVAGGTLSVTNISGTATLDVRRGTNRLNSGIIYADSLLLTNAAGAVEINGGIFWVRNANVSNGHPFFVGDGANSAYLSLPVNGIRTFADGLIVRSNARAYGDGTIIGPVIVETGGILEVSGLIGKLALDSPPLLQGMTVLTIWKTGTTVTNGQLQVNGALTYGGALEISNDSLVALTAGDRFPLFNASSYSGAFSSLNLPLLPFGLGWTNKLLIDGSIEVVALPASDRFWTNSLGGNYQVAGNWLNNLGPGVTDNANFTNNATYQVNWTADASAANAFFNAGSGTVTQAIGAFSWLLTNSYIVGQSGVSTASVALVSGTLHVANAAGTGLLEVRRGTNRLNGGVMDVDQLVLTNKAGKFEFNGGTLITRGATITNNTFNVGSSGGTSAVWDVRTGTNFATFGVQIGRDAVGSRLLLTNGGKLFSSGGFVGFGSTARSNVAVIAGAGSAWNAGNDFDFGGGGSFNQVIVSNAGAIFDSDAIIGNGGGSSNTMLVTGAGSIWSNDGSLFIAGSFNQLLVSGGGTVVSPSSIIDAGDAVVGRNSVLIAGAGSVWSAGTLYVGSSSSANQLSITNGAVVFGAELDIGFESTSTNNRVAVAGGELHVTNAVFNAPLDIRRGTNQLNSGLIEADRLLATNTLGIFEFNGGTLNVRTSTVANALTFFAGNGTSGATFKLVGNGNHSFANGLTIRSNASLVGNGTIAGTLSVQTGGTLSPGTSAGILALISSPVLQGRSVMEISKNGSVLTNDQVQVLGTLNYGGALIVTNIGPGTLSAGDQFQLFSASSYSGSFSSTILPPLNAGLRWNNNLLVNGSIAVGVIPPPAAIPLSGGTYTQDFNTLATNGLANTWDGGYTLFGWFAGESLSPFTITSYRAGSGTDLTGALYSFGSSGSNERALGSLASATPGTIGFGVCFTNDTAASVSNFTVSYTGEQWRTGGSGSVTNTLSFWYRVGAPPLTNPEPGIVVNWTAVTNLFFLSPIVSATAGALDGNQVANQHVFAAISIPGLIVPPGQEVFFRWTDPDDAGFDQAMAVDDLTVAFTILAPRIASITSNPSNRFAQIAGTGEPGFTYGIEAASNLNSPIFWQRLGSVTANGAGVFQFTDTNAPLFQARFYRALIP